MHDRRTSEVCACTPVGVGRALVAVLAVGVAMAVAAARLVHTAGCRWDGFVAEFWYEFVPDGEVRRLPAVEGIDGNISFSNVDVARDILGSSRGGSI